MTNRAARRAAIPAALKKAKLPETKLELCLAPHLVEEYDSIPESDSLADPHAEKRAGLRKEIEASILTVKLRALGARKYDALTAEHPPRTDVLQDREMGINDLTFKPAILRACMVEPVLDDEGFEMLLDVITSEEWERLLVTAVRLNRYGGQVPFSRGG
ncbi:hypothetical protein AB0I28_12635 [Phytomonospora sp. NPDC050363]|uniref:hypothetical protein n=1 Tax=Phytomonospora sp. NPDC050363 TaxID=3155642 RepID=UPI00340939F9